jgi:hypothetical protein
LTITKVEGTAAQLEALHRTLSSRQLHQSSLLPAIADAIKRAGDGTAEVDEWDITDRGLYIMYSAWENLGHGCYRSLGNAYARCAEVW